MDPQYTTRYDSKDVETLWGLLSGYEVKHPGNPAAWPLHLVNAKELYSGSGGQDLHAAIESSFDLSHMSAFAHNNSKEARACVNALWVVPLGSVPRYVNDKHPDVAYLARWRLEVGK